MSTPNGLALRADIANVARQRGLLPPSGSSNVLTVPWRLYHRVNVPAAGQTNFTFFNETRSAGVTNLDTQGQLPANQVMEVEAIAFSFLPGLDRLGQRLGVAAPTQAQVEASLLNRSSTIAASADPAAPLVLWQEKARELLSQGGVVFTINGRNFMDAYGLTTFPEGRGVLADGNSTISATFTAAAGLAERRTGVYNGAPVASNLYRFPTKVGLFPGQAFSVTVTYNRAVDFTQQFAGPLFNVTGALVAGTLTCELIGKLTQGVA